MKTGNGSTPSSSRKAKPFGRWDARSSSLSRAASFPWASANMVFRSPDAPCGKSKARPIFVRDRAPLEEIASDYGHHDHLLGDHIQHVAGGEVAARGSCV